MCRRSRGSNRTNKKRGREPAPIADFRLRQTLLGRRLLRLTFFALTSAQLGVDSLADEGGAALVLFQYSIDALGNASPEPHAGKFDAKWSPTHPGLIRTFRYRNVNHAPSVISAIVYYAQRALSYHWPLVSIRLEDHSGQIKSAGENPRQSQTFAYDKFYLVVVFCGLRFARSRRRSSASTALRMKAARL
jgi:hypothetical protein